MASVGHLTILILMKHASLLQLTSKKSFSPDTGIFVSIGENTKPLYLEIGKAIKNFAALIFCFP